MVGEHFAEKAVLVTVERGLHILRYSEAAPAGGGRLFPEVWVEHADSSAQTVTFVPAPGAVPNKLERPGDAMAVVATSPTSLRVLVRAREPRGSLDANVSLSLVDRGTGPVVVAGGVVATASLEFDVLGHLARRGDVVAEGGIWVGGPHLPTPVEGIELRSKGSGPLPIEYQVLVGGPAPKWSSWLKSAQFGGTRGRALPLLGVRIRATDQFPIDKEIRAEALFLGSSPVQRTGRQIELIGGGAEPLVGIRIEVAEIKAAIQVAERDLQKPLPASRKVRVFRAANARQERQTA